MLRRTCSVVLLAALPYGVCTEARAEEGFKSSGRYAQGLELRLEADPAIPLVGKRTLVAVASGGPVASVKFYVDGELVGTDESEPYESTHDFGPTPKRHEVVIVALTPAGTKSKRIFVTDTAGKLDAASLGAFGGGTPQAAADPARSAAPTAPPPPARRDGAVAPAAGGTSARASDQIAVAILEPFGDVVTGAGTIVVDARARAPRRIVRVEVFVDGERVRSLTQPPWEVPFDFGPDPRPREVKAVAYADSGDAMSAVWKSAGRAPDAPAGDLRVVLVTPKEGDYLAGPVTFEAKVEGADGAVSRVDFFVDGSLVGTATKEPWQVAWDAGTKVVAHTVKVRAYDRNGRRAEASVGTKPLDVAFVEEVREVVLTASFTDRQGRPLTDVRQEEVVVKEDGDEQPVTGFRADARPIVLALVMDASGSMESKIERTRQAAAQFVEALQPEDQAMVIAFSREVRLVCEPTSDKARLRQALADIRVETSTALHDAIHFAVERLKAVEGDVRRAVVLLSDGYDSGGGPEQGGSRHTYQEAEQLALLADVRCYTIDIARTGSTFKALGGSSFQDTGSSMVLKSLADQTGGESYLVESLGDLAGVYGRVAEELRRQYWISYRPLNLKKDGKWREIQVESKDRRLLVKTRAGYYAPGKKTGAAG